LRRTFELARAGGRDARVRRVGHSLEIAAAAPLSHTLIGIAAAGTNMSSKTPIDPTLAGKYPKAATDSSTRIRAAGNASASFENKKSRRANERAAEKRKTITEDCINLDLNQYSDRAVDIDFINKVHLTYDGGEKGNPPIQQPHRDLPKTFVPRPIKSLHVIEEHLNDGTGKGLIAIENNNMHFLLAPRKEKSVFWKPKKAKNVMDAFQKAEESINLGNARKNSSSRQVFGDKSSVKYTVMGVQTSLGSKGVKLHSRQAGALARTKDEWAWDVIQKHIAKVEHAFMEICPSEILRHLDLAREVVSFKTFPSHDGTKNCKYFASVAYAQNVYLAMHDDDDFTYSIIMPLVDHLSDDVILYFCFPSLGLAVPLRAGDILIFNPRTLHGVSSRCRVDDKIYCTSMYLKTKVVGGNDNSTPATDEQARLGSAHIHT